VKIWMWLLLFAVVVGLGALRSHLADKRKKNAKPSEEQKQETA